MISMHSLKGKKETIQIQMNVLIYVDFVIIEELKASKNTNFVKNMPKWISQIIT